MLGIINKEECCGCSACMQACPRQCIKMIFDEEGFRYPKINKSNCIECGLCEKICPIRNTSYKEGNVKKICVGYAKDDKIRLKSSSGGIFSLLAKSCIEENGVVYGASFNDTTNVFHIGVEKVKDINKLQGSKYLQSRIGNTFIEAKKRLENNQKVIYSGTPCQIAGLKSYLKKDYDNLLTVDVLCHGVPSGKLWNKYITEQEKMHESSVQKIFFRDKKYGWKRYAVLLEFSNNTTYECVFAEDPFMKMLLANISLRPSCYSCKFKGMPHPADITLGDCWGVEKHSPEMDDNKGTSVIMLNTTRGVHELKKILSTMQYKECTLNCAVPPNAESRQQVRIHPNRKRFFEKMDSSSIEELTKFINASILTRVLYKLMKKIGITRKQTWNCIQKNN